MFLRCQRSFRKIVNPCFDVRKPNVGLKNYSFMSEVYLEIM